MEILRTPDAAFAGLTDFPYEPHYAEVTDGLRMAWVEAGPADGPAVLLLHGEPTWSYLYRGLLPILAEAGVRAIVPDLVGFGRSDKPAAVEGHTYARHVEWTRSLVFDALDLREVTLVGQDWGGLIGLRLVAEHPDRFAGVVAANTGLPTGDHPMPRVWERFRDAMAAAERVDVSRFVAGGCVRGLSDAARAAYDAPFPDESYKAGPRAMPGLVPNRPDDPASDANRAAWARLTQWNKPFLVAFSDSDPITAAMGPILQRAIPGATAQTHPTIEKAGHFLQEDAPGPFADAIATFVCG